MYILKYLCTKIENYSSSNQSLKSESISEVIGVEMFLGIRIAFFFLLLWNI